MHIIEAKMMWCPFSRGLLVDVVPAPQAKPGETQQPPSIKPGINAAAGSFNRYLAPSGDLSITPPPGCCCLANGCAAWRWNEKWATEGQDKWPEIDDGKEPGKKVKQMPTGHCGLAGQEVR